VEVLVGVGVGVGDEDGADTTRTEAASEREPCLVAPLATPVAVAARVTELPADVLFGTESSA
jgi:hypothetical protein